MSIDLTSNFFSLLCHFRRQDLEHYKEEHDKLFLEAKRTGDHAAVISHYYSVMSAIIEEYFNGNFHFVPPYDPKQTLEEALTLLHQRIGKCLQLESGKKCLDIGCGIGGVMKDLAYTGAELTGITIAANEVEMGNKDFEKAGLKNCQIVEGDCHKMPIADKTFDAAYAIYALKYFIDLAPVFKEVNRVLQPGGLFVIYDLIKTRKYDQNNAEHREVVEGLEYACGMPSLHTRDEMVAKAQECGLELVEDIDLDQQTGYPYHYCFSSSSLFMWLLRSTLIGYLIQLAQFLRILPNGFYEFNKIFLSGTVTKIVDGGKMGILSGSEILVFRKK